MSEDSTSRLQHNGGRIDPEDEWTSPVALGYNPNAENDHVQLDMRWAMRVHERFRTIDYWRLYVDGRLRESTTALLKLETSMKEAREAVMPKPRSFVSMLPFVIPVVVLLGGFIWQAARYPDRTEFDVVKKDVIRTQELLHTELSNFKIEQVHITDAVARAVDYVQRIEDQQKKIDGKLDQLLSRRH